MATEEHLEILRKGVGVWNEWRRTNIDVRPGLSGANLSRANLSGALSFDTIFANIDLSKATGLDHLDHRGPSVVDYRTLEKSHSLPDSFLRGVGFSDEHIAYIPTLFGANAFDYYSCFISYSHEDKSFARRLHDALQGRGIRCWLDEKQLLPGDDIYEAVDRGIKLWDKVLLCCSRNSLTSWWVDNEIIAAFKKEQQIMKQRERKTLALIPLNLDGWMFKNDWGGGKKDQVCARLAADFSGWESDNGKFEDQFERVVKALQTGESGREAPPKQKF